MTDNAAVLADLPDLTGTMVAGSDGSPGGRLAADWAAARAALHGAALVLVRAAPRHPLPTRSGVFAAMRRGLDFEPTLRRHADDELTAEVDRVRAAHPDLQVTGQVVTTDSAVQVLAAISSAARLLVLGTTGASGVGRAVLGGTVAAVVHHAHGPVVVVPDHPGMPRGRVVVGLDDVPTSEGILAAAVREAAAAGVGVLAVHVWDVPPVTEVLVDGAEVERASTELLAGFIAQAAPAVEVSHLVRRGRADDVLTELSADASLVVVGSRGRGGFAGLLLGSVSRSLIAHPRCPVLVVRN